MCTRVVKFTNPIVLQYLPDFCKSFEDFSVSFPLFPIFVDALQYKITVGKPKVTPEIISKGIILSYFLILAFQAPTNDILGGLATW